MDNQGRQRRAYLLEYAAFKPSVGDVDVEVIFDEAKDHYELRHTGWTGVYRVHGSVIHIDIKGDKIWIEHDGTERGVALDLLDRGVPREHIVLGFKHPDLRPLTDFAVG